MFIFISYYAVISVKFNILLAILELLVVTTPPSPDVMVFTGCNEKVEISECLHDPIFKIFF